MMNKLIALVIALSAALAVTTVLAIDHTLAYVSFTIIGPGSEGEFSVQPASLSLGNLTAGESGSVKGSGMLVVNVGGRFNFELSHEDLLSREFSNFTVKVTVGNSSFTLTPEDNEYSLYLNPGTYAVSIVVYYTVSPTAVNVTLSKAPLISVSFENNQS
ncbi:hypothetical protein [Caldivirga maquilingensis]|nr:hypothetical protein [Caldivirga maquilingensis]